MMGKTLGQRLVEISDKAASEKTERMNSKFSEQLNAIENELVAAANDGEYTATVRLEMILGSIRSEFATWLYSTSNMVVYWDDDSDDSDDSATISWSSRSIAAILPQ